MAGGMLGACPAQLTSGPRSARHIPPARLESISALRAAKTYLQEVSIIYLDCLAPLSHIPPREAAQGMGELRLLGTVKENPRVINKGG